jgi:hypothetical protein
VGRIRSQIDARSGARDASVGADERVGCVGLDYEVGEDVMEDIGGNIDVNGGVADDPIGRNVLRGVRPAGRIRAAVERERRIDRASRVALCAPGERDQGDDDRSKRALLRMRGSVGGLRCRANVSTHRRLREVCFTVGSRRDGANVANLSRP